MPPPSPSTTSLESACNDARPQRGVDRGARPLGVRLRSDRARGRAHRPRHRRRRRDGDGRGERARIVPAGRVRHAARRALPSASAARTGGRPVTTASTRRFFFAGTALFTLVFIGLTLHTHTTIARRTNSDRLDERVVRGLHVWAKYNCENCHTLLGEGAYYAPDLTEIVAQRGKGYLTAFLENPAAFYSEERDGRL